jgi:hypothetical protein
MSANGNTAIDEMAGLRATRRPAPEALPDTGAMN